jgi:uncharacterized protein YgbK (DUF1537 family)
MSAASELPVAVPPAVEASHAYQLRRRLRDDVRRQRLVLAVVDDDPTGTQTVRDVPLVTDWEQAELAWAMDAAAPTFAVLTNSRAYGEADARECNRAIGERLARLAVKRGIGLRVISRSDSTLRGHFPAEPLALADGLRAGGLGIDAVLVCPAYPEAGRITAEDTHWVKGPGGFIPAAESEYARDAAFSYESSDLPGWIGERAGGHAAVASISLADIRLGGSRHVADVLERAARESDYIVVNACAPEDLDVVAWAVQLAESQGMRLLYRTGPSFVSARVGEATAEPLRQREIAMPGGRGLVVVGSHTELTTRQVAQAVERHALSLVTLDVAALMNDEAEHTDEVPRVIQAAREGLSSGSVALVTSRTVFAAGHGEESLRAVRRIAEALVAVVRSVVQEQHVDWLIAKGGITSHDMATRALEAQRATVLGQLFPGRVSVWQLEGGVLPGLRYVVFPGNVGDDGTLARSIDRLLGKP